MTELVNFEVKADFSGVDKMINRYGQRAVTEYKKALTNTSAQGLRLVKDATPHRTSGTANAWKWAFKGELITGIVNDMAHTLGLDKGWERKGEINTRVGRMSVNPKHAPALVFQVGKRTASKSATETLYGRYKKAMASLKGKGLSPKDKQAKAVAKSGVVVVRRVKTGATFKGKNFIAPTVTKIERVFMTEILKANERLLG